jgi:hypothetical protein
LDGKGMYLIIIRRKPIEKNPLGLVDDNINRFSIDYSFSVNNKITYLNVEDLFISVKQ